MASTKTWKSAQLPAILTASRGHDAIERLRRYFDGSKFTGASFERLGGGGDRPDVANLVTADDLVALSMLSVPVGGFVARELLLRPTAQQVSDLLSVIPRGASIETEEGRQLLTDRDGAAWQLWWLLRRASKAAPPEMQLSQAFGPVRTSKLLARKRPHLFPIYDSVVAGRFRVSSSAGQWKYLSDQFAYAKHPALVDRSLTDHLRHLRQSAGLDESISLLRALDVVVWVDGARSEERRVGKECRCRWATDR